MTDKETKAIERMKDLIHTCEIGIEKHGEYDDLFQKDKEAIETVLNLIEKQQAEIEKYKYLYQKALDNTIKADREKLEKDKIIELMSERLTTPIHSKEWVIEYYTKEVSKT